MIFGKATDSLLLSFAKSRVAASLYSSVKAIFSSFRFNFLNFLLDAAARGSETVKLEDVLNGRGFVSDQVFVVQPKNIEAFLFLDKAPRCHKLKIPGDYIVY